MPESSRRLVPALIAASLAGCSACGGSNGQIVGRQPDARFVTEKATLFVSTSLGIERMGLDGSGRRVVFGHAKDSSWIVFDVSADFRPSCSRAPAPSSSSATSRAAPCVRS